LQRQVSDAFTTRSATVPDLMRIACGSDDLFVAMMTEYKRNFGLLLGGTVSLCQQHVKTYTRGSGELTVGGQTAVRLLARTLVKAYTAGLSCTAKGVDGYNQATVLRMMVENASILMNEKPVDTSCQTLEALLHSACGGEANAHVALNEMESLCSEFAMHQGE